MFLCGLVGGFLIELLPVKGGAFISGFICFWSLELVPNQRPGSDWVPTIPAGTTSSQSKAPTETETETETVYAQRSLRFNYGQIQK